MRDQLLAAFRTKTVQHNCFLPLMVHDFFEAIPDYDALLRADTNEFDQDGIPSLGDRFRYFLGADGLDYRLKFGESIGADFLGWCQGWAVDSHIDSSVTGETLVDGRETTYITRTPVGEIVSKRQVSSVSHVSYVTERPIKTLDDLKVFKYVTEATSFTPNHTGAENIAKIGQAGFFCGAGFSCPFHELLYLFEAEDFLMMSFDMPQEVRDVIDLMHANNIATVKILADSPFQVFDHETMWDARQISPQIHSEFYVPFQKTYNDIFHEADKLCFDHVSGQDITPFIDGIEAAEFDVLYGLHLGEENVDEMVDMQKRWQGKLVGILGPDPDYLRRMSADQVKRLVGEFIAKLRGQRVIMGSSDAMVPGTPVDNLKAVAESLGLAGRTTERANE